MTQQAETGRIFWSDYSGIKLQVSKGDNESWDFSISTSESPAVHVTARLAGYRAKDLGDLLPSPKRDALAAELAQAKKEQERLRDYIGRIQACLPGLPGKPFNLCVEALTPAVDSSEPVPCVHNRTPLVAGGFECDKCGEPMS